MNFFPSPSLPLLASTLALKRNFFFQLDHFRNPPPACAPYEWAACFIFFFFGTWTTWNQSHYTDEPPSCTIVRVGSVRQDKRWPVIRAPNTIFRHPLPSPALIMEHIIQLTTYNIYTRYNLKSAINLKTYVQLSEFAISLSLLGIHHVIFTPIIAKVLHGTFIA